MKKFFLALILLASINPLWARGGRRAPELSNADFDMEKMKIGDTYYPVWNERSRSFQCHGTNSMEAVVFLDGDPRRPPLNFMCAALGPRVLGRISYANATGADLSGARISSAWKVILHSAELLGARFQGDSGGPAYLMDVTMDSANMAGTSFAGASLSGVTMKNALSQGADFSGANMQVVSFEGSNLLDVNFEKARLTGGSNSFEDAVLDGVSFKEATMTEVSFRGAKLIDVDMRGVYFAGTDLSGVNLDKVDLRCAIYHSNIKRFPFSEKEARARGMISELEAFGDGQRGIQATRPVEKCLQEIGSKPKYGLNPR